MKKRGQISIEFLVLMGLAMAVMIIFSILILGLTRQKVEDKKISEIRDLGVSLQEEIITAATVEKGYSREFFLPYQLVGSGYQVNISGGLLVITVDGADNYFRIPPVSGNISQGYNTITNTNGSVVIS